MNPQIPGRLTWSGSATAATSVAHSGEALGTVSYLRREKVMMPNGTVDDIPIISGNAVRGVLRDRAADLWWHNAGQPKLTVAVAHAIWSGGTLAKASGEPLTGARLLDVFTVCPVIEVFGAAGGGRIITGAVQVNKLVPVCQETAHLLAVTHSELVATPEALPSIWDLTQLEWFTRNPNFPAQVAETITDNAPVGARYGVETFLAGTRFATSFTLTHPSPAAAALFADLIEATETGIHVGGRSATGHGLIQFAYDSAPPTADLPKTGAWKRSPRRRRLTSDELHILARLD